MEKRPKSVQSKGQGVGAGVMGRRQLCPVPGTPGPPARPSLHLHPSIHYPMPTRAPEQMRAEVKAIHARASYSLQEALLITHPKSAGGPQVPRHT